MKNASLVLFLTAPVSMPYSNWANGDVFNPSYMPLPVTSYTQEMTFFQRLVNTLLTGVVVAVRDLYMLPRTETMLASIYPDRDIPSLSSLLTNSALLINHGTPFLGDGLRPVMPKTVLAGFMSCTAPAPLPPDMAEWVEGAEHGIIFVSFGSVIKASKMPESKRKLLLAVFSQLPQRVVWKWETEMPDAPANVKVWSWLPQTALLAHSKVRLFITHGGAGSLQETLCHQTPIVGIPIQGDQFTNVRTAVQKGVGVQVRTVYSVYFRISSVYFSSCRFHGTV